MDNEQLLQALEQLLDSKLGQFKTEMASEIADSIGEQNETICALLSQQNAVRKDVQAQVSGLRDIVRDYFFAHGLECDLFCPLTTSSLFP